jgi:aryl-alcohol dehydrogenase-like predicted oxidoreductase/predicted dehydrogenase
MNKVKWGIIGSGNIAKAFAHSIKYCENSDLISIFGRNEETVKQFSTKFGIKPYTNLEDFISSNKIDAVYIATPHSSHYTYSLEAIKNNKHILCEKPLTMNYLESMTLLNLAKEAKVFLMEAYMYRTHPQTFHILDHLDLFKNTQEKIFIESSFGFSAELPKEHRLRNPLLGGGAILDVGCYPLSMAKLIAGSLQGLPFADPESIKATGRLDETGVDLQSEAHLIFSDEIEAKISCAIDEEYSNDLKIKSGNLELIVEQPWHCGQFQDGNSSIKILDSGNLVKEIPYLDTVGLFTREIDHASHCIQEEQFESALISHADTQSNMLWLDKWRQELEIKCPYESLDNSPIPASKFYLMQKPQFKNTAIVGIEKNASRLALGCDNQTSSLHAFTMFDHFYGAGGRIFDTAYIYNNGKGDKYLGDWINSRNLEKDIIVIGKGAHTPQCEPQFIRPQIIESLERLNIQTLDIFCLHRDNQDIPVSEFMDALDEVKSEGLINLIGASNWQLERFSEARDYAQSNNKEPFTALSNNFSLAEMVDPVWPGCVGVNNEYINYLIKNQVMLFPWSSQARGFFIKKKEITSNEHFSNPSLEEEIRVWHNEKNLKRRAKCFEIAEQKNLQPIQVALAYVVQRSSLIFPLIGPRTIFETNSSIEAVQINLSDQEMKDLSID